MTGEEVLLFYIVCDESASMGPNGGIEAINSALPELHATLGADPLVVDKSRLSIIAFSDNAEVILPLCKFTDVTDLPGLIEGGPTKYGPAFLLLQSTIENDVHSLCSQGFRVHLPWVFFVSGSQPSDNWESAYLELTKHAYRPHIVCYGVDDADPAVLTKISTLRSYIGGDKPSLGKALTDVLDPMYLDSLISAAKPTSTQSAPAARPRLPTKPQN